MTHKCIKLRAAEDYKPQVQSVCKEMSAKQKVTVLRLLLK